MDLKEFVKNFKNDLEKNGGVVDDSVAVIHYIAAANKAQKIIRSSGSTADEADAQEYLRLCRESNNPAFISVAAQ